MKRKSLLDLPENQHLNVWIDYFSMPCNLVNVSATNQTPLDIYLSAINYNQVPKRKIYASIKKAQNSHELEQILANLFNFDQFSIDNYLILCENVVDHFESCQESKNKDFIPQFILRGFLVLSYKMKKIITLYLNKSTSSDSRSEDLTEQCWSIIHLPLLYLFEEKNKMFDLTIQAISPFLDAFDDLDTIHQLQQNEFIANAFTSIIIALIPYIPNELKKKSGKLFSFVVGYFRKVAKNPNPNYPDHEIIKSAYGLIRIVMSSIEYVSLEQSYQLLEFYLNFISNISYFSRGSSIKAISFSVDGLNLLRHLNHYFDSDNLVKIVHSIFIMLSWLTDQLTITNTNFTKNKIETEKLCYKKWNEYFESTLLVPDPSLFKTKQRGIEDVIYGMRMFFHELNVEHLSTIFKAFAQEISQNNVIKKNLEICIILYRSLLEIRPIYVNDYLQILLFATFFQNCFPKDYSCEISTLEYLYQNVYICFIFRVSVQNSNNMNLILKMLAPMFTGDNFSRTLHFLPIFRSCLMIDESIDFVRSYLNSSIYEGIQLAFINSGYDELVNQLYSFYQIMICSRPIDIFSSFAFIPIIKNSLFIERLHSTMIPCFKIGLEKSLQEINNSKGNNLEYDNQAIILAQKASSNIVEQILFILCDARYKKNLVDLALQLIDIMTESLHLFTNELTEEMNKEGFLTAVSSFASLTSDENILFSCLKFFVELCFVFPDFIQKLNNSVIYKDLLKSTKNCNLSHKIIDELFCFALNENSIVKNNLEKCKILNGSALNLLLDIIKDTEYELYALNFILSMCRVCLSNCFMCFSCGIIGYALSRLHIEELFDVSMEIFKIIGTRFYSPLAMNQTFRAMRLTQEGKKPSYLINYIEIFLDMILHDKMSPISSFFNFTGEKTGIVDCFLDPISFPFSIVTTFRRDNPIDCDSPLISISNERGEILFVVFFKNESMFIRQNNSNYGITVNALIKVNAWYKLFLIFPNTSSVQIYINNVCIQTVNINRIDFSERMEINVGRFLAASFSGDIGPLFFIKSIHLQEIENADQQLNNLRKVHKDILIKFLPWNVDNTKMQTIEKINKNSKATAHLLGNAIPYCSTITDVFQYNGGFEHFLPLFLLLNYQDNSEESNEDSSRLFYSLLSILKHILSLSDTNQYNFEKICGFRILTGFFMQMNPEIFTQSILNNLVSIFEIITLQNLRSQMTQFLWLNFDLWYRMDYALQTDIFNLILYSVWKIDIVSEQHSFDFTSLEFLLFLIQNRKIRCNSLNTKNEKIINNKIENMIEKYPKITFPGSSTMFFSDGQIPILSIEEFYKIQKLSWKFFSDLLGSNSSPSTFLAVFVVMLSHEDINVKKNALYVIETFLKKQQNDLLISLDLVESYEVFIRMIEINNDFEIKLKAIHCIFLLRKALVTQKLNVSSQYMSNSQFNHIIEKVFMLIKNLILNENFPETLIADIYDVSLSSSDDFYMQLSPIKYVELLPLFIHSCQFCRKEKAEKYAIKINSSIVTYPTEFLAFCENDLWPFWIFLFGISSYDLKTDLVQIVHLFSIVTFALLRHSKFFEVINFFAFFRIVEVSFNVNIFPMISSLLGMLAGRAISERLPYEQVKLLSIMIFQSLFFRLKKTNERQIHEISPSLLYKLFNMSSNENINLHRPIESYEIVFGPRVADKWIDHELGLKLNQLLNYLMNNDLNEKLEIITGIPIHCYDIMSFINPLFEGIDNIERIYTIDDFPSLSSHLHMKEDVQFFNLMNTNVFKHKKIFVEEFSTAEKAIRDASEFMKKEISDDEYRRSQSFDKSNFDGFITAHEKSCQLVLLHNHKLALSFIREVTSNGSPWSTEIKIVKWKALTKVDFYGRNIFWALNRNFDNHRKASAMRDSIILSPRKDSVQEKEISFKRILDQNTAFIPVAPKHLKALFSYRVTLITLTKQISGLLHISKKSIIFDGSNISDIFGSPIDTIQKYIDIPLNTIGFIFTRKTLHQDIGIEIFINIHKSFLINFSNPNKRIEFLHQVKKLTSKSNSNDNLSKYSKDLTSSNKTDDFLKYFRKACSGSCVQTISSYDLLIKSKIVKKWQIRKISNFTYLFLINILSSRSLNDLSQYPVFPWILKDYSSETLDFNNPEIFRDLSKPIGTLNEQRLQTLIQFNNEILDESEKCLYRSHYSNPAMVIGYLIRTEPFSTLHITLQDGRYDHPHRLFYSVESAWNSVTSINSDFREIIPEFFCSQSFLVNENGFDLGKCDGKSISDVELPKWAKNEYEFISLHRIALESEYISAHLNEWIDLIFGIYQDSQEKFNVFHSLTYGDKAINSDEVVVKQYCANFGSCPPKLFSFESPRREVISFQNFSFLKPEASIAQNSNQNIDGAVLYLQNERILTTKSLDRKYSINQLSNIVSKSHKNGIYRLNGKYIIYAHHYSSSVFVFNAKENKEIGSLMHNNCVVNCFATVGNYVVTGGSSCVTFIWDLNKLNEINNNGNNNGMLNFLNNSNSSSFDGLNNLALIDSFSLHTLPISSIDCNASLDLIASIDEGHMIFLVTLSSRKFVHAFVIENIKHEKASHILKITKSGRLIVTSYVIGEDKSHLNVYDLKGKDVAHLEIGGIIEVLDSETFIDGTEYIVIGTNRKNLFIVECAKYTIIKAERDKFMVTGIAAALSSKKAAAYVSDDGKSQTLSLVDYC
ncbi:hypothetical protein TRFO_09432 [Tritrichomonas foetus]|uniref:Beige/BEACH domain containing protein n=1 Tax=Tritrichomonas foetus TaxID=1144522 RepID=A0A1J4JE50_9EUKA|nr:hypothetical protein TRFO_09432 [Tritrichomonas foetus]|eukprot:OHS97434.1 hypothetical protein TRFO_09432 [Tritrichomonas foetus]